MSRAPCAVCVPRAIFSQFRALMLFARARAPALVITHCAPRRSQSRAAQTCFLVYPVPQAGARNVPRERETQIHTSNGAGCCVSVVTFCGGTERASERADDAHAIARFYKIIIPQPRAPPRLFAVVCVVVVCTEKNQLSVYVMLYTIDESITCIGGGGGINH